MLTLILAASEPSKVPFYIAGGLLVVWALALAGAGLTRPAFPVNERGTFRFELSADKLGQSDRVIGLSYSPVPEPTSLALVGTICIGLAFRRVRRIRDRRTA